jgi:hypothetical protein
MVRRVLIAPALFDSLIFQPLIFTGTSSGLKSSINSSLPPPLGPLVRNSLKTMELGAIEAAVGVGVLTGMSVGVGVSVARLVGAGIGVLVGVSVGVDVAGVHETVLALCRTNSHSEVPKVKIEPSPQITLATLPWSLALTYVEPLSVKRPS